MRYLSIFILLISLASCARFGYYYNGRGASQVDISEVSREILVYSAKQYHDKLLFLDDSVVYYDDTIQGIRLDFTIQPIYDNLWSTRELMVDTVEGFLEKINNNDKIVAQMEHYPFTADDLEVIIKFSTYFGKYIDTQVSAFAILYGGVVSYYTFTALDCTQDCYDRRIENYWQSKMFVEYNREGKKEVAPKKSEFKTLFETERYVPAK